MKASLAISYDREDDGRWIAEIDALPGCLVYGASQTDARRRVVALALDIVSDLVEHGEWETDLPELVFADAA